MRSKELNRSIKGVLEGATGIKFWANRAPGWQKPPFGVFSPLLMRKGEAQDTYDLMVNIAVSAPLEEGEEIADDIADTVAEALDKMDYFDDDQSWTAYLENIRRIDSQDGTLHQRRINFYLNYIRRT